MSDEIIQTKEDKSLSMVMASTAPIEAIFDKFLAVADVKAVYGQPIQHGEALIIPAAEVLGAMGFGMGSGYGESDGSEKKDEEDEVPADEKPAEEDEEVKIEKKIEISGGGGSGGGGGGGGRTFARPVAVIIAEPGGVRVEPVVDVTKVALAMFTTLGFMLGMAMKMRSPRRLE